MMNFNGPNYLWWFFVTLLCSGVSKECTKNGSDFESYLGTKTPYRIVANQNSSEIKYEGCRAEKLWAMVRHGTRNPNAKLIDKMNTRLVEIRDLILENLSKATDDISNLNLDLFRSWTSKLKDKDEKRLTHEGEDEMLLLAERLQNRFPSILSNVYSDSSIKLKFTATQRTKKSAQAFAAGLFGRNVVKDIRFPEPLTKDPILRFYKLCNKWRKEVSKNPAAVAERRKFEQSEFMAKTIEAINRRLGFSDELDLNDIHAMYMVCSFETAWHKRRRSPWCSAFSTDDFKVICQKIVKLFYFEFSGNGIR
jgi:multiple inositol-polyphosphate phosphatase/2,3-bisphosphoglycerate 3-phosphatase